MRRVTLGAAILFLIFPYLLLARHLGHLSLPEGAEVIWALKNSMVQAMGSSLIAVLLAFPTSIGLLDYSLRVRRIFEALLMSPAFLPPLFTVLAFMNLLDPFPIGTLGIVCLQGFVYGGLISVLLSQRWEQNWGGVLESAWTMGATRFQTLWALRHEVGRELLLGLVFVFVATAASFSIPFVVGGGRATNLEILIYEKIRISNDWAQALGLSLLQLLMVGILGLLPSPKIRRQERRAGLPRLWRSWLLMMTAPVFVVIFLGPLLLDIFDAIFAIKKTDGLLGEMWALLAPSVLLSVVTGALMILALALICLGAGSKTLGRLLRSWLAPSTALLGFAFLFESGSVNWIAYVVSMIFIFLPSLYRWGLDQELESLGAQISVAEALGAKPFLIWRRIVLPQVWIRLWSLGGITALWVMGEFALGQIILSGNRTLAMLSQSLVASYRIDAGLGVGLVVLMLGFLVFWGFKRIGHVSCSKLVS